MGGAEAESVSGEVAEAVDAVAPRSEGINMSLWSPVIERVPDRIAALDGSTVGRKPELKSPYQLPKCMQIGMAKVHCP